MVQYIVTDAQIEVLARHLIGAYFAFRLLSALLRFGFEKVSERLQKNKGVD